MTISVRRRLDPWSNASDEPRLSDVLADPIIKMMMKTDGISQLAINDIVSSARQRLSGSK
jgi:hypothetical protein